MWKAPSRTVKTKSSPYFATYASASRWNLASSVTLAASPSTTTSRHSATLQPVVTTQCVFCARFFALRSVRPVVKYRTSSNQTAAIGVTCGRPSGRTVDSQYTFAVARISRASSHGVAVALSLLNCGSSSVKGSLSVIARLLLPGRRRYVLVEAKEVGGIVATLDLSQPVPGRPGVGLTDAPLALLAEKACVRATVTLTQRLLEVSYPLLAHTPVLRSLVKRCDVDHDPALAVGEGSGLDRNAGHRPTQNPDLRHAHLRV